jgi:ankyrin repeat protein
MWFGNIAVWLTKPSLVRAAKAGKVNTVRQMLSRGGDVDVHDRYGRTALMEAVREGHIEVVKLLLEHGANIHKRSYSDKFAIDYAWAWGSEDISVILRGGLNTSNLGK